MLYASRVLRRVDVLTIDEHHSQTYFRREAVCLPWVIPVVGLFLSQKINHISSDDDVREHLEAETEIRRPLVTSNANRGQMDRETC